MKFGDKMSELINIKQPIINVSTNLESDALIEVFNACRTNDIKNIYFTTPSPGYGIKKLNINNENNITLSDEHEDSTFMGIKKFINEKLLYKNKFAFVISDFQYLSKNSQKNVAWERTFKDIIETPIVSNSLYFPLILISHDIELSDEISYLSETVYLDFPDEDEISEFIKEYCKSRNVNIDNNVSKKFLGFTYRDICKTLDTMFYRYNKFNNEYLIERKMKLMESTNLLELKIPNVSLNDVGGNENFKKWIKETEYCLSDEARKYNVPYPKGHLALGIAGSAKSFTAEALAASWNVPFIKINFSKILSKYAGQSEKNMSQAMELIKSCAPCVCLIDEVEKCLGGYASSNNSDSGALARVFAIVLDFLVNNENGVYVVMTSNDVSQLPPELTRAGRLDAIWYFSEPTLLERKEIFNIHLRKYKVDISNIDIDEIAKKTDGYTGAEIEQIIKSSVRKAFVKMKEENNNFSVDTELILDAIKDVIPISISSKEKIQALESWARGRALYASDTNEDFLDNIPNIEI